MTAARIGLFVLLASCSRTDGTPQPSGATGASRAALPPPPADAAEAKSVAACGADSDCTVRGLPDPSELDGGACCPGCGLYAAVSTSSAGEAAACDWQHRGICSRSCTPTSAAPPVARCVAGRCSLGYPPIDDRCNVDTDCTSVPEILPASPAEPCRLACGQSIAVSRPAAGWLEGLWLNPTVAGACPSGCIVEPRPDGLCVAGHCQLAPLTGVRVVSASVSSAYVDADRHVPEIEAIANQNAKEFLRCSERPRRIRVSDSWTLGLDFEIGADGRVTSAKPNALGAALPDIAQCIDGLVRQWHFAPADPKPPWHIGANLLVFLKAVPQ